jgi:hypothetical protein
MGTDMIGLVTSPLGQAPAQTAFNSLSKSGSVELLVFLLLFPTYPDSNAQEVNYAVVVLGFVLLFCVAYYWMPWVWGTELLHGVCENH